MWTREGWYGGARHDAISATHEIIWYRTRVHTIDATGAQDVTLPSATKLRVGFPVYLIVAEGNTLTLKDADGGTVGTLSSGEKGLLALKANITAAGSWELVK